MLAILPTLLWWKNSVLWVALMSLYANWKTADGAHESLEAKKAAADDEEPTGDQPALWSRLSPLGVVLAIITAMVVGFIAWVVGWWLLGV